MKSGIVALAACAFAFVASRASAQEHKGIEISIFGAGPAVDEAAFRQVRMVIAQALLDVQVERFIVHGFGVEGGFSACVQLQRPEEAAAMLAALRRITPNPHTTEYSVASTARCE